MHSRLPEGKPVFIDANIFLTAILGNANESEPFQEIHNQKQRPDIDIVILITLPELQSIYGLYDP